MAQPLTPRGPATVADLAALPDTVVGELVGGELHVSPRPAAIHAGATVGLNDELGPPFRRGRGGPGGWVILIEPELHLGADVLVPDMAGWRRARMPEMPEVVAFELAPDWVAEVLSPSTARFDRHRKLGAYAQHGVSHVWLIDPAARLLEVLRLDGATYRLALTASDDQRVRAEPFDAIELELAVLWAR